MYVLYSLSVVRSCSFSFRLLLLLTFYFLCVYQAVSNHHFVLMLILYTTKNNNNNVTFFVVVVSFCLFGLVGWSVFNLYVSIIETEAARVTRYFTLIMITRIFWLLPILNTFKRTFVACFLFIDVSVLKTVTLLWYVWRNQHTRNGNDI